jgi:DNA-binding transcriptional ArsR family regulator
VLACRVCDAILKKLSDYGQPVPDHVSFTKRELDELVGHASWGGRNGAQLARALYQLQGTTISARLFDKATDRWSVSSFSVLSEVLIAGRGSTIQACSVRPNPLIVESLRAKHYTCLNYERMGSLDVVGRQMFKRVFYHLSNLYDGRRRGGLQYVKDYGAICREWLGGLRELRYVSKIEQEQLGTHLRALQACGLIQSYQIARNARRDGFNIVFNPGRGFFDDYSRYAMQLCKQGLRLILHIFPHGTAWMQHDPMLD